MQYKFGTPHRYVCRCVRLFVAGVQVKCYDGVPARRRRVESSRAAPSELPPASSSQAAAVPHHETNARPLFGVVCAVPDLVLPRLVEVGYAEVLAGAVGSTTVAVRNWTGGCLNITGVLIYTLSASNTANTDDYSISSANNTSLFYLQYSNSVDDKKSFCANESTETKTDNYHKRARVFISELQFTKIVNVSVQHNKRANTLHSILHSRYCCKFIMSKYLISNFPQKK